MLDLGGAFGVVIPPGGATHLLAVAEAAGGTEDIRPFASRPYYTNYAAFCPRR
jgi:hypothetical protein